MAQPWEMDRELRLEQLSFAYVRALAAALGFEVHEYKPDIFGVDLTLTAKGSRGPVSCPSLGLQVKANTRESLLYEDGIHYPLKVRTYNDLRDEHVASPRILVVVLVPKEDTEWIRQNQDELAMRKCGYWISLAGRGSVPNVDNVTVRVPWENVLSADALDSLMTKVSRLEPL